MKPHRTAPELRFKGFTDAWKQRKLDSIYKKIRNAFVGTATPYYVDSGHFYLESNNVKDGQINRVTEVFINDEFYEKQKDKWLHAGDLVMVQSGHVGHTAVITEEFDGTAAHALIMFQEYKEQTDPYFLNFQFQTREAKRKLRIITTGNTIKHILASEMKKFEVSVPRIEEQIKIGELLKQLDITIALNQQKLLKLEEMKRAYLEQIFNQKIRFSAFLQEWERKKSDEIFYSISKKNHPDLPILSASQEQGMIYRDELGINIKYDKQSTNTYKHVLPGQFVIHLRSFQGGFAYSNIEGITSPAYTILDFVNKEDHYPSFWRNILTSNSFIKRLETVTYGIRDGRSISFTDFSTLKFSVPSYQEQQVIGGFFVQLDNIISLQQAKIDKLKKIKQGFLRKMFV